MTSRREFLVRSGGIVAAFAASNTLLAAAGTETGGSSPALAPPDQQPADLKVPDKPQRKAGWAIVGLGTLALEQVMPAFALAKQSRPVALVSGHPDKAKRVAEAYGISPQAIYNYQNYDDLASNRDVDIVYNILPNSMHAEYTIRALRAGKDVLCEKPMAANVKQAEEMIAVAKETGRQLMIAYRLHYEPFNKKVAEICQGGMLGPIKIVTASHCQTTKAPNIRLSAKLGGGPVGDVGIYCINAARYVTGEEPTFVTAIAHQPKDDPNFREVPESVTFLMQYPSGAMADCACSFGTAGGNFLNVAGAKGVLEMSPAFSYSGQRLKVQMAGAEGPVELQIQPANHFASEMDHFSDCVMNGKPCDTPGELGLADMKIVTAIMKSVKTGQRASLS